MENNITRVSKKLGPNFLSEVIAYIEDHTDTQIRLDELANIAGVSRFHFSRLFKKTTGKSPMVYVAQSRIRKAQQLILSGKSTLAEVALMVGFADQSHFTRQFQLYAGCTPAVYARNNGIRLFRICE
jgi:AraC family transcriptional regulator